MLGTRHTFGWYADVILKCVGRLQLRIRSYHVKLTLTDPSQSLKTVKRVPMLGVTETIVAMYAACYAGYVIVIELHEAVASKVASEAAALV